MESPIETTLDNISTTTTPRIHLRPRQLDRVLGKVLLPNQISVLHGRARRPMTHLCHMITIAHARANLRSYYVQAGRSYQPSLIRTLIKGDDDKESILKQISIVPMISIDDLEYLSEHISQTENIGIIIIDSLTSFLNLSTRPGTKERARKLFQILEILREIVDNNDIHILLTDHSNTDWQTGKYVPQGGNVLLHGVDTVVKVDSIPLDDDSISISIERTQIVPPPGGVLVKLTERGAVSLKSRGG